MAIQLYNNPNVWAATYRPVIFQFFTDLYPNQQSRESNIFIQAIRRATPQELLDYPQLTKEDILVEHAWVDTSTFYAGASIDIYSTDNGYYDGVHKVLERVTNTLTLIDTRDGWVGADANGLFRIHYTNFTVYAELLSENMTEPVVFKLKPTVDPNDGTLFVADFRDALARYFKDVKNITTPGDSASIDPFIAADGYITQTYSVTAYEAYDVVDEFGDVTFTKFTDGAITLDGYIAVNAVQPYHETERDGTVRLGWDDGLTDYVLTNTAGQSKRLLTHASRDTQFMSTSDGHYMAFLWGGTAYTTLKFKVSFYSGKDGGGSFISASTYTGTAPGKSLIVPMGAAHITVPGTAKSYKFGVFTQNENLLTEIFTFNLTDCVGANKRFYYLNKLGGIDAFTFQGDEGRSLTVGRDVVSKPHMNTLPGAFYHDWQRRTWRTTVDRRYFITSNYLKPEQIRSVVEPLFESANVWTAISEDYWTNVLIFTGQTPADGSSERMERMTLEYGLGVDNVSQRT